MAFSKPFTLEEKEYILRHDQKMTWGDIAKNLTEKYGVEERTAEGVRKFIYNYRMEFKQTTVMLNPEHLRWLGIDGIKLNLIIDTTLRNEIQRRKTKQARKTV